MTRQWLRWGSATVLLVAAAALSGLQTAHPGERVGAVAGALAFGVLLALILRFAFLKVRRSPRPLWAPAVPAIGAAVLILAALGQASNRVSHQQSERVRLSQDLERACGRDVRPTFRELSGGFRTGPPLPRCRPRSSSSSRSSVLTIRRRAGSSAETVSPSGSSSPCRAEPVAKTARRDSGTQPGRKG